MRATTKTTTSFFCSWSNHLVVMCGPDPRIRLLEEKGWIAGSPRAEWHCRQRGWNPTWREVRRQTSDLSWSTSKYQPACKPGSVGHRPFARTVRDGHSSGTMFAHCLKQPTRTADPTRSRGVIACANRPLRRPYSVLLPVWFAMPSPLPATRCALTAPFHPYPRSRRRRAVRSLWHFPWGRPRRTLSGTVCRWSPDFPPRRPFDRCRSGRPAD